MDSSEDSSSASSESSSCSGERDERLRKNSVIVSGQITLVPSYSSTHVLSDLKFVPVYFSNNSESFIRAHDSKIVALLAKFSILPICLLCGSACCIAYHRKKVYTGVRTCKVKRLTIKFSPNGSISHKLKSDIYKRDTFPSKILYG